MGKASRDKGKVGEREARDKVRALWNSPDCQRSAQVSGLFVSDVSGGPEGLHLEVKRYKKIAACRFMEQAIEDSGGHGSAEGSVPTVLMREDFGDWHVMVRMEDAEDFARRLLARIDGAA